MSAGSAGTVLALARLVSKVWGARPLVALTGLSMLPPLHSTSSRVAVTSRQERRRPTISLAFRPVSFSTFP